MKPHLRRRRISSRRRARYAIGMIDHVSFRVRSFAASRAFYTAALAPLDYRVVMEFPDPAHPAGPQVPVVGLGAGGKPDLWFTEGEGGGPIHIAFSAKDRAVVDEFYRAAIAAGGRDNGAPGLRPHYHPGYFGAFVLDPDGNNVEVVCHAPA
jgi:catechol 2,3-dioxygenase-like lactoylglutathione lyase family enzyme